MNSHGRKAGRVEDLSREILQDSSKELSVIIKHSELDDDENLNLPQPLFGKKESFLLMRPDHHVPKIEIELATPSSSVKLLGDNVSPPIMKNQKSLRAGASPNTIDVDHIFAESQ